MNKSYIFDSIEVSYNDNVLEALLGENCEIVDLSAYNIKTGYNYLFYENTSIREVVLPDTLEKIELYFFYKCTNLKNVIFKGTIGQFLNEIEGSSDWVSRLGITEIKCTNGTINP